MKRLLPFWGFGCLAVFGLVLGTAITGLAVSEMDKLEDEMTIEALESVSFEELEAAENEAAEAKKAEPKQAAETPEVEDDATEQAGAEEQETAAEESATKSEAPAETAAAEAPEEEASGGSGVPPQMVTLDAAKGKAQGLYSPVDFDHELHLTTGACTDCHHMYEQTGTYQPCSNCHEPKVDAASPKMSLFNAYHNRKNIASCVGCHTEMQVGPTGCRDCHTVGQ
ncbi:cytochrome c3 family protein [Desulfohalobium retbaense]|uniref:Cytochrome c class III n=1 Tax=Desulfohalobium retbaense (strain ATCC 49708 / DSM 5692 / JCM 16813 / HR100) TaxID=485915 RepID=C8X1Y2_DESRD|nr:cytochrome c3 family protein [Desulfohalobium retbaense]ACV68554.1 cytochrome c class III [Desulfohalobium retbaense DSM 5692]